MPPPRLYPPIGRLERTAKETVEIRGITIPKNMSIMVPVYALHRDSQHWPEPEEFNPDRYAVCNLNAPRRLKISHGGKLAARLLSQ